MAYFKAKDLKLGTNQSVYFGDSDEARLWFDGSEWAATYTISGTAATADYHLIQKGQVDTIASGITDQIITDHSGLSGLTTGDDHTQYILATGSRAFTGVVVGVTPTDGPHLTTKDYVDSLAQGLDWQDSVVSKSVSDPTTISGVSTGDRYIIGPSATGAWVGNDDGVAEWNGSTWDIETPNEGFAAWVEDEDILYVYNGSAWVKFGSTVDHGNLIGLSDDDHPQYHDDTRGDARYYTQSQVDTIASGVEAQIITDHGGLSGLGDDDHIYYVPTDGSRGFTSTVSGIDPTQSYHLATKQYIDDEISTLSSGIVLDHGSLTGLGDDDHTQYTLADGSRDFSNIVSYNSHPTFTTDEEIVDKKYVDDEIATVSGIIVSQIPSLTGYATESYVDNHNWYEADILDLDKYTQSAVDTLISGVEAQIITDHGGLTGLGDDDHTQYILVDGTRGFTATVSGVDPTASYHLTTKYYVDDAIATLSGSIVLDHGGLTGLGDDDHTQYLNTTRGDARYYTETELDNGQLDNRYYTETEITTISGNIVSQIHTLVGDNLIGTPGTAGFGVGICPQQLLPNGMTSLFGYDNPTSDNYGNYQYKDGSIMCWIPKFYYLVASATNTITIKGFDTYTNENAANLDSYALHRAFIDGGTEQQGFFVDKYMCSKTAWGTGYVAASIKNGLPISAHADHNPIADLTACDTNAYFETIDAAHARDGVDGAVNASSMFNVTSKFQTAALAMLSLAHGQAVSAATYCAWYDATYNYPKGCNNDALKDYDEVSNGAGSGDDLLYVTDGYSNCGKTGSGVPFAKSTHNGQNCGVADLNGLMYEVNIGITCIASTMGITGASQADPCVITVANTAVLTTGDWIMITSVVGMTELNNKIYQITVIDGTTFSLDGINSGGYTAYGSAGTITYGTFYTANESTAMKDFTSSNSGATDHWGATGVAAMMSEITMSFESGGTFGQRMGSGANQVLSEATSGNAWLLTGLGFSKDGDGIDTTGTNLFGKDRYYQYIRNELCVLSCSSWNDTSLAGVWHSLLYNARTYSFYSLGFRLGLYPE